MTYSEGTKKSREDFTLFCTKCGTKNDIGAKFCKSCGAPLIQPKSGVQNETQLESGIVSDLITVGDSADLTVALD